MTYTPINQDMYLAAFSGALAGMGASNRVPNNTQAASYAGLAAIAGAFAESFDASWNDASTANVFETAAGKALSESTWQQRGPTTASVVTLDPANYTNLTDSLCAIIRGAGDYLTMQGITPGTGGGSSLGGPDVTGALDNNAVVNVTGVQGIGESTVTVGADNVLFETTTQNNYNKVIGFRTSTASQLDLNELQIVGQNADTSSGNSAANLSLVSGCILDKPNDFRYAGIFTVSSGGLDGSAENFGYMLQAGNGTGLTGEGVGIPAESCWATAKALSAIHNNNVGAYWHNPQNFGSGQIRISRIASTDPQAAFLGTGLGTMDAGFGGPLTLIGISFSDDLTNPDQVRIGENSQSLRLYMNNNTLDTAGVVTPGAGAIAQYLEVEYNGTPYKLALYNP